MRGKNEVDELVAILENKHGFGEWIARRGVETDFHCEYCGNDLLGSVEAYDSIQIDHVVPTSRDGEHNYENMALSCKTCNFMKRDYFPKGNTRIEMVEDASVMIRARRTQKLRELTAVASAIRVNKDQNDE